MGIEVLLDIIFVDLRGLRGFFFPPMLFCVSDMLNAVLQLLFFNMYNFFHVVTSEMIGFIVFSPWLCYIHLITTCSHFDMWMYHMIMWHSLHRYKPYLCRRLIIKTKVALCTPLRHVGE